MDSGYQARFLPLASLHVAIECFYLEHNVLQYRNSLFHTYFRFDNIFLTWNRSLTQRLSLAEVSRKTALICFASLSPSSSVTALSLWRVRICHQHLGLSNPNWGPFSSWRIYLVRFNRKCATTIIKIPRDLSCCRQEQQELLDSQQDLQSCRTTPGRASKI